MRPQEVAPSAQPGQRPTALSAEGRLTIDDAGCVVWANVAAQRMLGWEGKGAIGQDLHSLLHFPVDPDLVSECSTCLKILAGTAGTDHRDTFVRSDRSVFPVSFSSSVEFAGATRETSLSFHEIADRRQTGLDAQILGDVSLALSEAKDSISALTAVLRILCSRSGAALGRAWLPSKGGTGLICSPAWYSTIEGLEATPLVSKEQHFVQGTGSVGRAWSTKTVIWCDDLGSDFGGPLFAAAARTGLKSALAVPLIVNSNVEAVLQILYCEKPARPERITTLASEIAARVGPIIHRKQQEETTHENAALYAAAVESAYDAIITMDLRGDIQSFNVSAERMFGFAAGEVIGKSLAILLPEHFHGPDPAAMEQVLHSVESDVTGRTIEMTATHRDGSAVPVELSLSQSTRHGSSLITCILREIGHRKKLEEAVRAQSNLLRWRVQFLELARDAIIVRDIATDTILFWSEGAEAMYGWFKGEAIGRVAHDLLRTELSQTKDEVEKELLANDYWEGDIVCAKRNGTRVILSSRWVLQRDENAQPAAVLEIHSDITERQRIESERAALLRAEREHSKRLRELAALRDDVTAMVVHELSSPLAAIGSLTHVLSTDASLTPEQAHLVAAIRRETDALCSLVADVGNAASLEREGFVVHLGEVWVRELLEDTVALAETLHGNHSVVVSCDTDLQVHADRLRIGQVLRNLISNAAKYSSDGSPIEIRFVMKDRKLRVEVANTSASIRHSDLNRIFEKFGRGSDAISRNIPGKGLGLYLSREIVRAHGSDVTVTTGPASMTVFGFELEIAE